MIYLFHWELVGNTASGQFFRAPRLTAQPTGSTQPGCKSPLATFQICHLRYICHTYRVSVSHLQNWGDNGTHRLGAVSDLWHRLESDSFHHIDLGSSGHQGRETSPRIWFSLFSLQGQAKQYPDTPHTAPGLKAWTWGSWVRHLVKGPNLRATKRLGNQD